MEVGYELDRAVAGDGDAAFADIAEDALRGLRSMPKTLPSKYFYDQRGSELFERITELPEYYQTRTEHAILRASAADIVSCCRPRQLVELGSGTATKTRTLLDAMAALNVLESYVPVDISESVLLESADRLTREYAGLDVRPLIADFEKDLGPLPEGDNRLIVFLGGTIGNFVPRERRRFLARVRELMGPEDHLVLGVDLVKSRETLEAAYNDSAGVTADFNKNMLRVLNSHLDGDFDPALFEHVAFFNEEDSWVEMRLRALADHHVRMNELDMTVSFRAGEEIRTEISCKFTRDSIARSYREADLRMCGWYTDRSSLFALAIAARVD